MKKYQTKKRFGQHFLHDQYVIQNIVTGIYPQADENLIENGDFENFSDSKVSNDQKTMDVLHWAESENLPAGYATWSFTKRPAQFVWTDKLAHSGKYCIGIEENEVKSSIMKSVPVEPGQRYEISVYATRISNLDRYNSEPRMTIGWQGASGWAKAPRLTKPLKVETDGEWGRLYSRVSVPPGASKIVVMLSTKMGNLGEGGVYFDDLSVRRIDDKD